jgi:hypothetical protein
MKQFIQNCEISFILRKYNSSEEECIELALIGLWENQQIAIPLWILNEKLLGFEIILPSKFSILDSEPLIWNSPSLRSNQTNFSQISEEKVTILAEDIFKNDKIFFKIYRNEISISEHYNEVDFFERIASIIIPELDEIEEE